MGILVADRRFFGEIGSLDAGMKIYGGENVELGIRVRLLKGCAALHYVGSQFFKRRGLCVSGVAVWWKHRSHTLLQDRPH